MICLHAEKDKNFSERAGFDILERAEVPQRYALLSGAGIIGNA